MDNYSNYNPNAAPPPTSIPDFNYHQLQHQRPPPPPPPQAQWYPNQTHYQSTLQPPPPPGMLNQYPTHQQHWNPHPTENHAPYAPPVPYPNQQYPPHQFALLNRPQMHPPAPYHVSQVPTQTYSAGHQEWGNPNWTQHQGIEQPGKGNSDDWAARARAWAAAKIAIADQQQQSSFPPTIRPELQTQYHDQYVNVADPQNLEAKPGLHPVAYPQIPYGVENYPQVPLTEGQSNNTPGAHQYGQVTFSSASMTSGLDNRLHKDGSLADESRKTVHQKEVPSSYSSSAGREVVTNQNQMQFSSYPGPGLALQGGHQLYPMPPAVDQPDLLGKAFSYHNQNGDLSDKPLDFTPRANISSVYPTHGQSGPPVGVESSATMPIINHDWASHLTHGSMYPSAANSGLQFDPSISASAPVHGKVAPVFVDAYVASSADRPKKAAVPNWLKEEIIKKKAVMATSAHEYHKEETQFEDEIGHQSFVKDDQAESKSVDYSRSPEEEDDDEDYVQAARTAAINKEIKRVLTEVLLKVTDNLFDEIATRVLSEEEVTTEAAFNQSSAKVLVPDKSKGTDAEKDRVNLGSELPGGLLGLVSYGTDSDDENDELSTQERMSNMKHESIRNGHSPDKKVDNDTKSIEKLGAMKTDSFGRRVVDEIVSGTKESDTKNQNGISSFDLKNNVQDDDQSNQDRTKETSGSESRIASDKRAAENKTISRTSPFTNAAVDRVRESKSRGKDKEKHLSKGKLDNLNRSKDIKKEVSVTDEKQKYLVSKKRSSHYDDKYKTETGRREGGRENNRRDQLDDDKSKRSRHKHSSNSNRHKKGPSPSPSSSRKRNKTDSSASGEISSNDESLDGSERKSLSKRRHRSPSPVRSRKRKKWSRSRSPSRCR